MRFKREQLYLLIFIVALVLALVKAVSLAGRVGFFDTLLLLVAGIGLGATASGLARAVLREMTQPAAPRSPARKSDRDRSSPRARARERSGKRKRDEAPARDAPAGGERKTGTVKWFNNAKGFGFISPDNGDKDCFVHRTAVAEGDGLPEGARVEYEVIRDDRGRRAAANVKAIGT